MSGGVRLPLNTDLFGQYWWNSVCAIVLLCALRGMNNFYEKLTFKCRDERKRIL